MKTVVLESGILNIPKKMAEKLKGREFELVEVKEGILLKLAGDAIKEAKGFLAGKRFSSERYLECKKEDEYRNF